MNSNALEYERNFHGKAPDQPTNQHSTNTKKNIFLRKSCSRFSLFVRLRRMLYWEFPGNFIESSVEWKHTSSHTGHCFHLCHFEHQRVKKRREWCSAAFFSFYAINTNRNAMLHFPLQTPTMLHSLCSTNEFPLWLHFGAPGARVK